MSKNVTIWEVERGTLDNITVLPDVADIALERGIVVNRTDTWPDWMLADGKTWDDLLDVEAEWSRANNLWM